MPGNCNLLSSSIGSAALRLLCLSVLALSLRGSVLRAAPAQSCVSLRADLKAREQPETHRLLADCEEAAGNFREAANQYQIAARADPSEQNLFAFGSQLLKYKGYREALQVFSYSVTRFAQSAKLRVGLGVAQYSLGQYQDAVETLCRAVDLNPDDPRPLEFLGKMIGLAPGLSNQVESRLERFALLYPENAAANYYYAMSLRSRPETQSNPAREYLLRALKDNPTFAQAHYELGSLYAENRQPEMAVRELEKAVQYRPAWRSAHYKLAQLYAKAGQAKRARQEFKAVNELRGP